MNPESHLLITVLRQPEKMTSLSLAQWDLLVRQARNANLLARLEYLIKRDSLIDSIPEQPRVHLQSSSILAQRQKTAVRWEVNRIQQAMKKSGIPVVLLKGAAYVMAELPSAHGRLFADIDIIVPKAQLKGAENAMLLHGWITTHLDEYDQRYYRQWMHELPPMRHIERKTVVDMHHTILPETARLHPPADKLLADKVAVEGHDNLFTLSPTDMVLHSATHLFHDGELEHGLRDLVDLDALLRHFGKDEHFWQQLPLRAKGLDLTRPLFYALRYTQRYLQTPIPAETIQHATTGGPNPLLSPFMDALFVRGLAPDHASCDDWFTGLARWLLYVRSHFLRMPLHLLVPHLVRKAIRRKLDTK